MNNLARILRGAQFIEHPVARSGETIFIHPITTQFLAVQSFKTVDPERSGKNPYGSFRPNTLADELGPHRGKVDVEA